MLSYHNFTVFQWFYESFSIKALISSAISSLNSIIWPVIGCVKQDSTNVTSVFLQYCGPPFRKASRLQEDDRYMPYAHEFDASALFPDESAAKYDDWYPLPLSNE